LTVSGDRARKIRDTNYRTLVGRIPVMLRLPLEEPIASRMAHIACSREIDIWAKFRIHEKVSPRFTFDTGLRELMLHCSHFWYVRAP
jgi:hypothetical protein